jgi:dTDP-4-dehydrorhamnose reductase
LRCLLIGASGQLGTALRAAFSKGYDLVCAVHQHRQPGDLHLDLGDENAVRILLDEVKPGLILIAGAFCAVDRCESERDLCERVNVSGPRTVAGYARQARARVVYYSTDHVFDGTCEESRETDSINPLSNYAQSKARTEAVLREMVPDGHLILRTSWVYGPDPQRRNFALRCLDQLSVGRPVTVPSDQWGSPTVTEDLAAATRFLVKHGITGLFHATGPDFIDRYSLALKLCVRFGLDRRLIVTRSTKDLGQAAMRPLRPRLDCGKLRAAGAPRFRGIDEGLRVLWTAETSMLNR